MDIEQRVDEHEVRLKKLEINDIKQQMKLQEIQTTQVEIKNMLLERDKKDNEVQQKNNEMMQNLIKDLTESVTETIKCNNTDNTYTKKQIWIFVGSIIALFSTILVIISKVLGV